MVFFFPQHVSPVRWMSPFSRCPDSQPWTLLLQTAQPYCRATLQAYSRFSGFAPHHSPQHFSNIAAFQTPPAPSNSYACFFISSGCISSCCPGWILLLYPPDKATACMIESLPPTMRLAANLIWELFIPSWYLPLTTIKVEFNNWDSQHPSGTCPYFSIWLLIVWFYLFTVLQVVFGIQSSSLTRY